MGGRVGLREGVIVGVGVGVAVLGVHAACGRWIPWW